MTGTTTNMPTTIPSKIELPPGSVALLPDIEGITAFSTGRGAVNPADPYDGFNACHYTGDDPVHIAGCRRRLCDALSVPSESLVIPRQTHSARVAVIDTVPVNRESLEGVDALVTSLPSVALAVNTADCVPVVMADPEAGVIAAVHSGWRGTVDRIVAKAVTGMVALGADPSRISAAMGPCIGPECFEVGEEVAERFETEFPGDSTVIYPTTGSQRPHVDLPRAVAATLIAAGVRSEAIAMPPACSRCDHRRFFSARRLGVGSGRTLSVIIASQSEK